MKKAFFVFLIHLFVGGFAFTQNELLISGVVVDEKSEPLLGNVLLISASDSSLVKGEYFESGKFTIQHSNEIPVLLKVRSSGFRDTVLIIPDGQTQNIDLGQISMTSVVQGMDEVKVVGKLPLFETTTDGGLKVNVQNTMLAASTSLLEVLGKSPNLIVGEEGIVVVGKGIALIYLDGNQITMHQLGSISVNQVKHIEIISNPPARFDANGRAVILIKTIVNSSEGIQGTITGNATFARNFLPSVISTINYRKKKWSLSADYGIHLGKDWESLTAVRTLSSTQGVFVSDNAHLSENKMTYVSNYKLGAQYHINDKHRISAEYRGFFNLVDLDETVSNEIELANGDRADFNTYNDGRHRSLTYSAILNYFGDLDTLGSNLFIGTQYSAFSSDRREPVHEEYSVNEVFQYGATRLSLGGNDINIFTSQLDYTKVFNRKSKLQLGTKLSIADNGGVLNFYSKQDGEDNFTFISNASNEFTYNELLPALYAQYSLEMNKTKMSAGVRSEYTIAEGFSKALNTNVIDTNYINFFPSFTLQRSFTKTLSVGLGYSARIGRPNYRQLDPFVYYQDSLTSFQGNPYLVPELTNSFELDLNLQGFNFFKLGFNHSKNTFRDLIEPGNSGANSIVLRKVNLQQLNSYFAKLSVPVDYKFWSSFNTVSLTFDQIIDERPQFTISKISPQFYLYSYHKFNIKNWFNLEVYGEYVGRQNDGVYFSEPTYSISGGISRKFFKRKLSVRLIANDILRSYRQAGTFNVGDANVVYEQRLNTNFYRVSLTYNFGKLKNVNYENKETGKEERNRLKGAR
jgi:hypothetical protein